MAYRIFAINPDSTSTKIAMFEDDRKIFSTNVAHDAEELKKYKEISNQFDYRKDTILAEVAKAGLTLEGCAAFSGRGDGLVSCPGGTYTVNAKLYEHAKICFAVKHPAVLGAQLAKYFATFTAQKHSL